MTEARRFLASPDAAAGRTLRFVNYFGEQRFGSARHGRGFAARRLIEGDFEEALRLLVAVPDRKDSRERKGVKRAIAARLGRLEKLAGELPPCPERAVVGASRRRAEIFVRVSPRSRPSSGRIAIEAYQSWLWNEVARRVIAERCAPPLIEIPSRFGDLVFPGAAAIPAGLAGTLIPLFSPETALEEPWRSSAEAVLAGEGIALGDLRVPGLRSPYFGEVSRPLFVDALEFVLGPVEADESSAGARRFKRRLEILPSAGFLRDGAPRRARIERRSEQLPVDHLVVPRGVEILEERVELVSEGQVEGPRILVLGLVGRVDVDAGAARRPIRLLGFAHERLAEPLSLKIGMHGDPVEVVARDRARNRSVAEVGDRSCLRARRR